MLTTVVATARTFGAALRGLTLDSVAGLSHAARAVAGRGRRRGPATLVVRVLILSDERGRPLTTADRIWPALRRADRILREGAGIRVRVAAVETVPESAPTTALDPRANRALLRDHLRGRTAFYRRHVARRPLTSVVGDPVTVIVVRDIAGRTTGCSLGVSADWVICQASLFDAAQPRRYDETVLAHELGHALNLPHSRSRDNLMFPSSSPPAKVRGTALNRWQRAVLHANRHTIPSGG